MQSILLGYSRTRIDNPLIPLGKGVGWGIFAGLAATLVMDIALISIFLIAGMPPFTCFSIIGDTVARLFSLQDMAMAGTVLLGASAHYGIGPLFGAIFGAAAAKVNALRVDTWKRGVVFAVLFAEILSQPMLALTPVLLHMTASETLQWFGGSFGMHLIWGCALGFVWSRGLRLPGNSPKESF